MRFFLSLLLLTAVQALLEEDAGQLDFVVATAGHGPEFHVAMSETALFDEWNGLFGLPQSPKWYT